MHDLTAALPRSGLPAFAHPMTPVARRPAKANKSNAWRCLHRKFFVRIAAFRRHIYGASYSQLRKPRSHTYIHVVGWLELPSICEREHGRSIERQNSFARMPAWNQSGAPNGDAARLGEPSAVCVTALVN